MRLIPRTNRGRLSFYRSHVQKWTDHATEIGSSPAEVADYAAKVEAAEAARFAQQQAQNAAQSATLTFKLAMEAVATSCGSIVMQIRSKARTSGNSVYSLASIAVPDDPSPLPAPGTPIKFVAELTSEGSLKLSWKCANPKQSRGTLYEVWRSMGFGQPMEFLAVVGERTYTDTTLPPGIGNQGTIEYKIIPIRSTGRGATAIFPVLIGGGMTPPSSIPKGKAAA